MKKAALIAFVVIVYGAVWLNAWSPWCPPMRPAELPATPPSPASLDPAYFTTTIVNPGTTERTSHVSSVAALPDGRVVAVWYAGSKELAQDVRIFSSTLDTATGRWSPERVAATKEDSSAALGRYVRKVGNPVVFTSSDGSLWLVYVAMPLTGWSSSSLAYRVSHDGGETWSAASRLYLSPLVNLSKVVKNKPLPMEGGALLLPVYHELDTTYPEALMLMPEGGRLRYAIKRMLFAPGLLQPSVTATSESGAGGPALAAFFRNATPGERREVMRSVSTNGGSSWSAPVGVGIPNPDSGIDVVSSVDGRMVMVANDTYANRAALSVFRSSDGGRSWEKRAELENTPGMEFSYPSIIRTPEGIYHLTYTYGRARIKHAAFSEAWLWKDGD